ncbi:hypothetical protein M0805_009270 [Coniferiporia weirii]|nr:hypothetical protein M0805_009270 [Coniferiporia weirii]
MAKSSFVPWSGPRISSIGAMFSGDFTRNISPLQSLIARAVDPYKHEPDYAAHLEVAEHMNTKKANTPREAAMTIARIVNNRNPHISILALALLETLVQQCGYAFHLQIATKEFLNELVRRFPERPPPFPGPVMTKILELIHTWKETICVESRWKEDLGNIRDMHRLLTFKGYRFRDLSTRVQPAVASTSNLKSAEELEEEDREAQAAKLQELIRRGTPRDLAAAQELMKSLAGAEPDKKPDYRSQSLTELNKLEQKVILLNEMLDNVDTVRGERFASGDAYDQVSNILSSARPKIQKWISDAESGDPEMLDIFLQMNDQINSVLNRYEAFKKGDFTAAANPIPAELAGTSRMQDTSLIDFDDLPAPSAGSLGTPADDLASIFGSPAPAAGRPSNPPSGFAIPVQQPTPTPHQSSSTSTPNGDANAFANLFNSSPSPTPSGGPVFGSISLPWTPTPPQPQQTTTQPSTPLQTQGSPYRPPAQASQPQGAFWSMQSGAGSPLAPQQLQRQQPTAPSPQAVPTQTQAQGKDPFADLAGLF